ncbi:MAG: MotA/TolQ/ExbB proton channel family protein [Planctomycetota bacterium]|nr:MotA/TolQ/ExbB proton channel family protein [Planctomycetota bacterium]
MKKTGSTGGNRTAVALLTLALLMLGVGFTPLLFAQEDGAPVTETVSILDNILQAGGVGIILIILSIAGVSLIIMYAMQMRRDVLVPPELLAHVEGLFDAEDYESALDAMEQQPCYLSSVLSPGLLKIDRPYGEVEDAMEDAGEMEAAELHRKISYISLIAAIAPMLGLLGTVMGMVKAFNVIATSKTSPKPKDLAGGISEALMTTMMGLIVAIPMTVAFFIFKTKIDAAAVEVSSIASELMDRFDEVGAS